LFERLRAVRLELAAARGLPAYMILHDAALREMARVCPRNEEEFAQIPGVGAKRAGDFAERLLAVIAERERNKRQRPG
jgi:ATP-dependent DNA helicase RecQ